MDSNIGTQINAPDSGGSKIGLITAVLIGVMALILAISVIFDFNKGENYRGMIQKLENHKEILDQSRDLETPVMENKIKR